MNLMDTLILNRYLYCGANPLSYVDVMGFGFTDYVEWGKDSLLHAYGLDGSTDLTTQMLLWGIDEVQNSLIDLVDYKDNPNCPELINMIALYGSGTIQGIIEWGGSTLSNGIFAYKKVKAFEKDSLGMCLVILTEGEEIWKGVKAVGGEIKEKGIGKYAEEKWNEVKKWFQTNVVEADPKSRGRVVRVLVGIILMEPLIIPQNNGTVPRTEVKMTLKSGDTLGQVW